VLTIPTDYAWNTWSVSNITDNTTYVTQTSTASDGGLTSPNAGYDAGSGYVWDRLDWTGVYLYGVSCEARTADTSATVTSATYFDIVKDCTFPLAQRKRFVQVRFTLATNPDQPELFFMLGYLNNSDSAMLTNNKGLTKDAEGSSKTWDGVFLGRKYQCGICGRTCRRNQMLSQRGSLVCRETCWDKQPSYPSLAQTRRK
jgi:hypothetical protein